MSTQIPIIAIVGRPNVGKSTFFNRLVGKQIAVVEDEPGVTRDRNYALSEQYSIPFYLVDTAGFETESTEPLNQQMRAQVLAAVEEADSIMFIVDAIFGLHPGDEEVIEILRRDRRPFTVVANKCDGKELEPLASEFYQMGVDRVVACSALHGRGVKDVIESVLKGLPNYESLKIALKEETERGIRIAEELEQTYANASDLMDEAEDWFDDAQEKKSKIEKTEVDLEFLDFAPVLDPDDEIGNADYIKDFGTLPLPNEKGRVEVDLSGEARNESPQEVTIPLIRVAIIGRPNVGKSTLLNAITKKDRAITSPIAGTTRDCLHEVVQFEGQDFELIDTAGMRKKGRIGDAVEQYSVLRSMRAISTCDVAVVVLDATSGATEQDGKIVGLAHEQGKGIVLVVNKWDAVEKDHTAVKTFEDDLREAFKFSPYASIFFISAKNGKGVNKPLKAALEVAKQRLKRVPTHSLNQLLRKELPRVNAPVYRGRELKLYYAAQVDVAPPRFMLVMNNPKQAHFSYLRFIKNVLRNTYGFAGTDIKLVTRKRSGRRESKGAK